MVKRVLTIALGLILAAGCSNSSARHQGQGRAYDSKNGFSIVPPAGWTAQTAPAGTFMCYSGPVEDGFAVNFNVVAENNGTTDVSTAMAQTKRMLAQALPDYTCSESTAISIDGKNGFKLSGRFTMGGRAIRNTQYIILTGKKAFTITFTAADSSYSKFQPLFEPCAMSALAD